LVSILLESDRSIIPILLVSLHWLRLVFFLSSCACHSTRDAVLLTASSLLFGLCLRRFQLQHNILSLCLIFLLGLIASYGCFGRVDVSIAKPVQTLSSSIDTMLIHHDILIYTHRSGARALRELKRRFNKLMPQSDDRHWRYGLLRRPLAHSSSPLPVHRARLSFRSPTPLRSHPVLFTDTVFDRLFHCAFVLCVHRIVLASSLIVCERN